MYCIDCGTQNLDTTRYCKSCGANLESLRTALTRPVSQVSGSLVGPRHVVLLLVLSGLVGVAGLGIVAGLLIALTVSLGPSIGGSIAPLLFFLGAAGIAGVCFIVYSLLRMLRTSGPAPAAASGPLPQQVRAPEPPRQLNSAHFQQHVPSSVVEHTTARLRERGYAPPDAEGREREV